MKLGKLGIFLILIICLLLSCLLLSSYTLMSNTVIEPMYKLDKVNTYTNPSNMNLALVYRGFYKRNGIHKTNNFNADIFKNHLDSIHSLGVKNIDIYIHTYSVNEYEDKKLLSIFENYNLKRYVFEKNIKQKISYSIIKSLELVYRTYDLIINTRFDVYFIRPLNKFNINNEKLNLFFKNCFIVRPFNKFNIKNEKLNLFYKHCKDKWIKEKIVSDLIYIFPPKYKHILIAALKKSSTQTRNGNGHWIYKHLNINENEINFMIDGFFSSNTDNQSNKYVYIKR